MRFLNWEIPETNDNDINALIKAGIPPLAAKTLAVRGVTKPEAALSFLDTGIHRLSDPWLMTGMDAAVLRTRCAIRDGEHIAVYGDYDVDGITAVCIMVKYLRSHGAKCSYYIPSRLEEGYGLNAAALCRLKDDGVSLVITVDSGITAIEETVWAKENGIDLIITDHHECKDIIPSALAVINPRRPDCTYPFKMLAGVGVAFKFACCLSDDMTAAQLLDEYSYLAAIGTIADVMPLIGENRAIVAHGLKSIQNTDSVGLRMLINSINTDNKIITSNFVSFNIAPRINAAGRMCRADVAVELLLTDDIEKGREFTELLCKLNDERRFFEQDIFNQAKILLEREFDSGGGEHVIVLGGDGWHQGVIGIVASRMAEYYRRPTFLICLDGETGKASARSYGGLNLYGALESCSDLLCTYGGHELAVGFTIKRENIDVFRTKLCQYAKLHMSFQKEPSFKSDGLVSLSELTASNVEALSVLEPHGTQNPTPVFFLHDVYITEMSLVGNGKHLRFKVSDGSFSAGCIFFSADPVSLGIADGDRCDILFSPQINNYRNTHSVQLVIQDIKLSAKISEFEAAEFEIYRRYKDGGSVTHEEAAAMMPSRAEFMSMWRYLKSFPDPEITENLGCLCRKATRLSGLPDTITRMLLCLDVFEEHNLITLDIRRNTADIKVNKTDGVKVDLSDSKILQRLRSL